MSMRKEKSMGHTSHSKDDLRSSIHPGMRLSKNILKRIYGYGVTRQYYESWVNEYETARNAELKEVAHWYRLECELLTLIVMISQ